MGKKPESGAAPNCRRSLTDRFFLPIFNRDEKRGAVPKIRLLPMLARNFLNPISPVCRRFQVFCAVGVYLVTLFGVPVPRTNRVTKEAAYPCQYSRCGCTSAEQCWRSCCCHTLEERVAWARAHGVTPPDFVLKQLKERRLLAVASAPKKPCCQHHHDKNHKNASSQRIAGKEHHDHSHLVTSSSRYSSKYRAQQKTAQDTPPSNASRWILMIDSANCQGLQSIWQALGTVTFPPSSVDYPCDLAPAGIVSQALCHRYDVSLSVPFPPPRT